jgi:hypothetical protein
MRAWLERGAAALLLAAAAAPFWTGRYLPFLDLPQHLGLAAVVTRYHDPATHFALYYAIDLRITPYWGYYGSMWLLGHALPLELANRVLFTAYAVGMPLASAFLLASFGRDRRWSVLTIPLVFNTNLFFGFATFLLSIPLFLVALGLAERHLAGERGGARRAVPLAAMAALVFLFHAQTYLLLGACVALLVAVRAGHGHGARWVAGRCAPYLPSLALFAAWFLRSFVGVERPGVEAHTVHHRTYGGVAGLGAVYEPLRVVLEKMPERVVGAFTDGSDQRIALALLAVYAAAAAAAYGRAPVPEGDPRPVRWRRFLLGHRCDLVVLVLLGSYLLVPMEITGHWYLNPRNLVFAALALPLLLGRAARGWRSALVAAGAVVSLLACANAGAKVRAFQRQVGPFDVVARELPRGGRVLGLPFDDGAGGPVRTWPLLHWACWEQVSAGGDVGFSFAGLPSIPVRYRPGMQAPHPYEWRPDRFDWATMGAYYDAFLVSGAPRGRGGEELGRNAAVVARAGPWSLWKPRSQPNPSPNP